MSIYKSELFNNFKVISSSDKTIFLHLDLSDSLSFYKSLFDYFFDENRLLRYIENKSHLTFCPNKKNYATLYKNLLYFIDDFNQKIQLKDLEQKVLNIIAEEYELNVDANGNFYVRLDKMGKIGEYIFCNILSEYYGFDCIIPKIQLSTDFNMSIYGIDVLFYSSKEDLILFGESKLSKSLSNGINLLNKSLETYEDQISNEYYLIFSNRLLKDKLGKFGNKYAKEIEYTTNIQDFISLAGIKRIAIPLFIAHGTDIDPEIIIKQLNKINKSAILGLETQYIIISLPFINKSKIISVFTEKIRERMVFYEQSSNNK